MAAFDTGDIRRAILQVLEHDRWNSNLSDDHIAEKVVATLKGEQRSGDDDKA